MATPTPMKENRMEREKEKEKERMEALCVVLCHRAGYAF